MLYPRLSGPSPPLLLGDTQRLGFSRRCPRQRCPRSPCSCQWAVPGQGPGCLCRWCRLAHSWWAPGCPARKPWSPQALQRALLGFHQHRHLTGKGWDPELEGGQSAHLINESAPEPRAQLCLRVITVPGPKSRKELVEKADSQAHPQGRDINWSGVEPRNLYIHHAAQASWVLDELHGRERKNFTAASLWSGRCWAHLLLILFPKGPNTHMPHWSDWPAGKCCPFPDPGNHTKQHAQHLDRRVPGRGTRSGGQRPILVLAVGSVL